MTRLFFIYFDFYLFDISRKHPLIEKKFLLSAEISAKTHKKTGEAYASPAWLCHSLLNYA